MEDHPWDIANDEISTQAAIRMYRERGEEVPEPWRSMLERGERVRSGLTMARSQARAEGRRLVRGRGNLSAADAALGSDPDE